MPEHQGARLPEQWGWTKGGAIGATRLPSQAIYGILRRMANRADTVSPFSPHDLRRTAGIEILDAGDDLAVVADILGHASVEVTRRSYDRRGEKAMRKAAALVSFSLGTFLTLLKHPGTSELTAA